ncbi:MAG: SPOR domain-containing protein [Deltaproteobacteria bacterium]|nr:SPOR domain-containing protein [Deltaproteobacteria bacterium]
MMMRRWLNLKRSEPAVGAAIELDRWQLTGMLGAVLVACAVSFFAGVLVGKRAPAQAAPEAVVAPTPRPVAVSPRERNLAMAGVSPNTAVIDDGLSVPVADPIPSDPTDAARIETHRQLQDFRAAGRRRDLPPVIEGGAARPEAMPLIVDAPTSDGAGGYTLQVSVFESRAPAEAIASELEAAGHAVTLRQLSAQGKVVYRVEVGDFRTAAAATTFQRRFERDSGYSGVLVPRN